MKTKRFLETLLVISAPHLVPTMMEFSLRIATKNAFLSGANGHA